MNNSVIQSLLQPAETKILLLVMDGLGGIPKKGEAVSELEAAYKPESGWNRGKQRLRASSSHRKHCRPDAVACFGERACMSGGLGPRFPAKDLMPLAQANARRLKKFGA